MILSKNYAYLRDMNSMLCIVSALGFFIMFAGKKVTLNELIIDRIAKAMYGVFLVQVHPTFRNLWCQKGYVARYYETSTIMFIVSSLMTTLLIFLIAILFETIRIPMEEAIFKNKSVRIILDWVQSIFGKFYSFLDRLIKSCILKLNI